jgi:cobalamin biosynthesis Mg chelatase CobN
MQRKALSLFLSLLVVTALVALAQSPTSSAPGTGTSATQDPYGATLDHPNPNSATEPTSGKIKTSTAPATDATATSSGMSTTTNTTTTNTATTDQTAPAPSGMTDNSAATSSSTTSGSGTLPRTASELPLIAALGLLALFGALAVRTLGKRAA